MLKLQQTHQETVANLLIISFLLCGLLGLYAQYQFTGIGLEDSQNYYKILLRFIGLFFNCFAGCIIVIIWLNVTLDRVEKKLDLGLAWLAIAILLWCIADLILIFIEENDYKIFQDNWLPNHQINWIIRSISILNSVSFLYFIKYIKFGEKTTYLWFIDKTKALSVGKKLAAKMFTSIFSSNKIPVLITIILLMLSILIGEWTHISNSSFNPSNFNIANLPDVVLSLFTTAALIVVFDAYFRDRKFKYMKYIVWFVSIIIILAHWFYLTGSSSFEATIVANTYRPFIIILFFIISTGQLRYEKEALAKFQRRDMNHAIRGTLNILQDDISNQMISTETEEDTYFALEDINMRVRAMYTLHDLVNQESDEQISFQKYIRNILENIETGLNYNNNQFNYTIGIDKNIKISRTRARKLGSILVELAINANRIANSKRKEQSDFCKKLYIYAQLNESVLEIKVVDNGLYIDEKKALSKNRGLKRLYAIVQDDLKGKTNISTNNIQGTTFDVSVPLFNLKNS